MNKIQNIRRILERQKGRKAEILQNITNTKVRIKQTKRDLHRNEQAREIIRKVGLETQKQLQYQISDITSLALEAVFDDPYQLIAEFVQRRNKTECDLFFTRNDHKINPLEASGFGAIDVAAFALRVASWCMQTPHTRNVLVLDEPFKHLKGKEENLRVLQMIKQISTKINKKNGGLQIIMISDERISRDDIIASADRTFEVKIKKGVSYVLELNES